MKIKVESKVSFTPRDLADCLAHSSPDDFASFWFAFSEIVRDEKIDLVPFAAAMAPELGAIRQRPLRELAHLMEAEIYKRKKTA